MDFSQITRILQVALGIGAVIFVHELGHFIAARLCKVRVEIFSLGFGPKLLAWKRGTTTYQLALVPMGGYVKMAGEESAPGELPLPDELPAKSVGQRFFIYSGGVLMNVLFALVVLPPLLFYGVPFPEPLIGAVAAGGPAWKAGLTPGTRVLAVDGEPVISFEDLHTQIGLSSKDEIPLLVRAAGSDSATLVNVRPGYAKGQGIKTIDVGLAADPQGHVDVAAESPAFAAGLRDGDRLVAVNGARDDLATALLSTMRRGDALELEVLRESATLKFSVAPKTAQQKKQQKPDLFLGVEPLTCLVRDIRPGAATSRLGLLAEDRILSADAQSLIRDGDFAAALRRSTGRAFDLVVLRDKREVLLAVPPLDAQLVGEALRDIALVSDTEGTRAVPKTAGAAAQAGIEGGDRIVRIADRPTEKWSDISAAIKALARVGESLTVNVERRAPNGSRQFLDFQVTPGQLSLPEYGVTLRPATYIYRAETFGEAAKIGAQSSWKFLVDTWHTLSGIFRGSVSGDSIGGIIAISQVSYFFASMGLAKLIFFLCTLSLNLAFINVLPIPVLDGGHLFFLLIEKIKGSPVNERVLGYSQMVGLVLILGLVVFVTFNDIRRLME